MTDSAVQRDRGPARVWAVALGGCLALAVTSAALPALLPHPPARIHRELAHYFDVASNTSLPAWWATGLLLAAALAQGVAGVTSRIGRVRGAWCWPVGAVALAALSLNEHTEIDERLETLGTALSAPTGLPHPLAAAGAVGGVVVAVALALLALREPARCGWLLVVGTALLAGGVVAGGLAQQQVGDGMAPVLVAHGAWLGRAVGGLALVAAATTAVSVTRGPAGARLRHRRAAPPAAPAPPPTHRPEPADTPVRRAGVAREEGVRT